MVALTGRLPNESPGNTTLTPLGSGETFTGNREQNNYPDVMVMLETDNGGCLFFDFSVDGENFTTFPVNGFQVTSGIHEFHTAVKGPRWFRVCLINDSGAQTYLRLVTYYGTWRQSNAPLNQPVGLDTDAANVRPTSFQDEISLGRRTGITAWAKFGHRDALVATSGAQTIWDQAGNYVVPTTASTMTINYDGTAGGTTDGAGTTGATVLRILYIDENGLPQTLDHTLETDGVDITTAQTLGINRVAVIGAGALTYNASDITITATTGGALLAGIKSTDGITHQAIFHVGSNHDALFKFLFLHMNKASGGAATVQILGYVYNRTLAVRNEIFRLTLDDSVETSVTLVPEVPFLVSAASVLYFTADTTRDGAEAVVRFSGNEYQRT